MSYRDLAYNVAKHGYIVAVIEHPKNNRLDNSAEGTLTNLQHRPQHISALIDWFYQATLFEPQLIPNCVSIIGHSMGGYSVLAVAGGHVNCFDYEADDNQPHPVVQEKYGYHVQLILDQLPEHIKVECQLIDNAGHFAFLGPFSEALKKSGFIPAEDPTGFDRTLFLETLHVSVVSFFERYLR